MKNSGLSSPPKAEIYEHVREAVSLFFLSLLWSH